MKHISDKQKLRALVKSKTQTDSNGRKLKPIMLEIYRVRQNPDEEPHPL